MSFTVVPQALPPSTNLPTANTAFTNPDLRAKAVAAIEALQKPSEAPVTEESRQNNTIESVESSEATQVPAESKADASVSADKLLSSKYAELAKQTKALRLEKQRVREKEIALKAAEEARNAVSNKPSFDESQYISKDRLKQDLFGTLTELGLSYDDVTNQALNAPTPEQIAFNNKIKMLEAKLADLEGTQTEAKKNFEDQQQQSRKQAEKQISFETQSLVKHNPEFETIRETNSTQDVVDLITSTFDKGLGNPDSSDYYPPGTLLSVEDAAKMVEDYLVEEALKISKIKKIQQRLNPAPVSKSVPNQKTTEAPKQSQMKTLTNNLTSSSKLSARERAILVGEGKLAPSWKRS